MASEAEKTSILVVDDASDTVEVIERHLSSAGYRVFTASAVSDAVRILEDTRVDLVVTDFKMPKTSGLDLVRHVRDNLADTEVMMITGYPSIEGAVEAVKNGAQEYLAKPFTAEELLTSVRRALDKLAMRRAARTAPELAPGAPPGLIGRSSAMQQVFSSISKAAATTATVLILGESGTGKELVARAIHYGSDRATSPFVPVNCGGIPESLLESELFGHVKGAFTGATESRAGFFHAADGGAIFLDEISETSLAMQVKLLRVLQDREVCMVGATRPRKVDVRIIAASNKDLLGLVGKGAFREDLYFRLNVLCIEVPPLRDRSDDVLLLARHFVAKFAQELRRSPPAFTDRALEALCSCPWPGNVRELENLIQRSLVMLEGDVIDVRDLPVHMRFSAPRGDGLHRTLAEVEAEHVRNVLASVGGNVTVAAKILGIDRKTVRKRLNPPSGTT